MIPVQNGLYPQVHQLNHLCHHSWQHHWTSPIQMWHDTQMGCIWQVMKHHTECLNAWDTHPIVQHHICREVQWVKHKLDISRGVESKTFIYLTTKIQYLLPKKCFAPISLPTWIIVQVKFDVCVPGGGCWVGVCIQPRSHQRCVCADGDGSCHAQMACFSHKNVIISAVESSKVHWKFGHCKCLCKQKTCIWKCYNNFVTTISYANGLIPLSVIVLYPCVNLW